MELFYVLGHIVNCVDEGEVPDNYVESAYREQCSDVWGQAYFQLTHAATTPNGSHRTSLYLYIIRKLVGLLSGLSAFSPCCMVHFNFSTVTKISPRDASTFVFPESRQAAVAMVS